MIFDNYVVPIPNYILNACVCNKLEKEFSRNELLICSGFMEIKEIDDSGIIHKAIRLNVRNELTKRGFIMPILCKGLILALKIFRYPNDENPFILNSKSGGEING